MRDLKKKAHRVRRRARPVLLETAGVRIRATPHGVVAYLATDVVIANELERTGYFAQAPLHVARQALHEGATVVDVGAHVGMFTLGVARSVGPSGTIVAFEPQRPLFHLLCANVALNGLFNVSCRQQAVGISRGRLRCPAVDYTAPRNYGAASFVDPQQDHRGESVDVTTIDQLKLTACDFIKIDVEGMEREVLVGARGTIERHRPILCVENNLRDRSPALIATLLGLKYRLFWIVDFDVDLLAVPAEYRIDTDLPPVRGVNDDGMAARMAASSQTGRDVTAIRRRAGPASGAGKPLVAGRAPERLRRGTASPSHRGKK